MLCRRLATILTLIVFLVAPGTGTHGAAPRRKTFDSRAVLYSYLGRTIKDSRWGKVALFQGALSDRLTACGKPGLVADGQYGRGTRDAIVRLTGCTGFQQFKVPADDIHYGAITRGLWAALLQGTPPPGVRERAFAMSLSHEGTDYDTVEWNYGTSDDRSALTWGPYGATAGHGNEIRGILRKLRADHPTLLTSLFGGEFTKLAELMESPANRGYDILKEVHRDAARRDLWKQKFQVLGGMAEVRRAYEWYAFETDSWLRPPIKALYDRLIPSPAATATEVDYGLFLDLAMHMSITNERLTRAKQALDRREVELGRRLTPAERRQVISLNLSPSAQRQDRLGRNVVYYVDGVGTERLSPEERAAWEARTGRRASSCALSDDRKFYPF